MKLFGKKSQEAPVSEGCAHPISHHVLLREDASDHVKVTAVRCSQCGARLVADQHLRKTA